MYVTKSTQMYPIIINLNLRRSFFRRRFSLYPNSSIVPRSCRHRKRNIFDRTHFFFFFLVVVLEGVLLTHAHARTRALKSHHRRYALTRHRRRQPPRRRSAVLTGSSSCPSGEHMLPHSPCARLTKLRWHTIL